MALSLRLDQTGHLASDLIFQIDSMTLLNPDFISKQFSLSKFEPLNSYIQQHNWWSYGNRITDRTCASYGSCMVWQKTATYR